MESSGARGESGSSRVWLGLLLWALCALLLAAAGVVVRLPRPAIAVLIWSPVLLFAWRYRAGGALRRFVDELDLRLPVLFHLVRVLFGVFFLYENELGRVPAAFARVAGPGDIVAGALAIPVLWLVRRPEPLARKLVFAWNLLGLLDILAVFLTAQRLMFIEQDPLLFSAFQRMPYPTLPLLIVPLVIITHGVVFLRLRDRS